MKLTADNPQSTEILLLLYNAHELGRRQGLQAACDDEAPRYMEMS